MTANHEWYGLIVAVYLIVSTGRVFFYIPQVLAIMKCNNRASSSSIITTAYLALSFWVSAFYFQTIQVDLFAFLVAASNGVAMTGITGLIFYKRRQKKDVQVETDIHESWLEIPSFLPQNKNLNG